MRRTRVCTRVILAFVLYLGIVLFPGSAHGQLGKALARSAERNLSRSAGRSWFSILRRDMVRDRATRAEKLASSRSVFRYTTTARAKLESRAGISAGSHLTARAFPGRPSASFAQKRLGLPVRPTARERVLLPKGTAVRLNKALGGKSGYGEVRLAQPVQPENIQRVVSLPKMRRNLATRRQPHP